MSPPKSPDPLPPLYLQRPKEQPHPRRTNKQQQRKTNPQLRNGNGMRPQMGKPFHEDGKGDDYAAELALGVETEDVEETDEEGEGLEVDAYAGAEAVEVI